MAVEKRNDRVQSHFSAARGTANLAGDGGLRISKAGRSGLAHRDHITCDLLDAAEELDKLLGSGMVLTTERLHTPDAVNRQHQYPHGCCQIDLSTLSGK